MQYTTLLFDVQDGVAHVTLNRPDAANSLNGVMTQELDQVMLACEVDPAIRAVLISGKGRMFCAGGDLKTFHAQGADLPRYIKQLIVHLHAALTRMAYMDAPVIAAVHGAAAGAGMSLANACDLVIAAESARFSMAYTAAGLTPDGSSTYFLPRAVGLKRALELTLTNRTLSAQEALDWGIVTQVVPDDQLMDRARALAAQLASGPTRAFGGAKRLLRMSLDHTLETQMEYEAQSIAALSRSPDGIEGITAFLEKRKANFAGR
jgi:2-(1,2-epoxy-1,2-dihydrophenyl)acetyl-CoA isomerase